MGSGLLVLSVGEGVRQGGSVHSCKLSSRGRISKTLSTTGDEVFFKLATASPRVTPVKSIPFTFNKMSPAQGGSRQYSFCSGLTNTLQHIDSSSTYLIFNNRSATTQRELNCMVILKKSLLVKKVLVQRRTHSRLLLGNSKNMLALHGYANAKKSLFQYTNMFPNHTKGHSCCTAVSYIKIW